jgi:exodeoxyribonuclease-3
MITIATWNVNSVRQREGHLLDWLRETRVDVACLQELKTVDDGFPREAVEALGYEVATHGQKGFNGVAILSRLRLEDVRRGLPGDPSDEQARYIEAVVSIAGGALRVACVYCPNGNPAPGPKYDYKLAFMERLTAHARDLLALEEPLAIVGDYNVIPRPEDAKNPDAWIRDALFMPDSRDALARLAHLGFTDALLSTDDAPGRFTFWDYQAGAFQRNDGIRIDHVLLSPEAAQRLSGVAIDREMRAREKPSDHVPVRVALDL